MRPCLSLLLVFAMLAASRATAAATVAGRVTLPKSSAAPVANKRYEVVSHDGILATNPPLAVVYLEGDLPPAQPPAQPAQIVQRNMTFVPSLLPVQAGTRVEFPNLDGFYHNIFSFSPAKRFDLGRYRSDERPIPSVLFEAPGLVVLRCDIHEHMRALILVVPTAHFVITDAEGRYQLAGLPAGRYTLKAWLDSRTTLERPVELRDGATLQVDFP